MIAVRSLQKKIGQQEILRGVDLKISSGETLAIIGRSGGGKNLDPGSKHHWNERAPARGDPQKGWHSISRWRAF
jgi:ABC-type dipeptide/oligopeptide/nickel transport system ATPase component